MYEIKQEKSALREKYKSLRQLLTESERQERDARICGLLISLASFRYSGSVLLYSPLPGEIDVNPLADEALKRGKRLFYPISHPRGVMTYHEVKSREELRSGRFGIGEPAADAEGFDLSSSDAVCIIPALAFDRDGYRLGYGGGYYDRFLMGFSGTCIGVIYSDFVIPKIPRGRFDLPVGLIVTERGVRVADDG